MLKSNNGKAMTATEKFDLFIERYAESRGIDIETAKSHKIVQEYRDWINKELNK